MRTRLIPLAVLLAAALAGCGDSDEPSADEAKSAYGPIEARLSDLGESIARELQAAGARGDAALERAFAELERRGEAAAEQIDQLDVPDELADRRDALGDAIDRGTEDLGAIVDAVRDGDVDAARAAVEDLVGDSQAIGEARESFERALDDATR
jgi:hypothetical protein